MPTLFDHAIVLLLVVVGPLFVARQFRKLVERVAKEGSIARRRAYVKTMTRQWALTIAILVLWLVTDRSFVALGLGIVRGLGFFVGLALVATLTSLFVVQIRMVRTNREARQAVRAKLANVRAIMPHDGRELVLFACLALTAGICEEIVYRGFLTWYATQYLPLWAAIPAVAAAFGLGHAYQGTRGVLLTGVVGLILGLFCWMTGSLWLAMYAHALTDANSGLLAKIALAEPGADGEGTPRAEQLDPVSRP